MSGLYSQHLNRPWMRTVRNVLIALVLICLAVATLFPIYYMIVSSFGAPVEAGGASYSLFPTKLTLDSYKTKTVVAMLNALGASKKTLIVTAQSDEKVIKSAANIPGVKTTTAGSLNVYDMLGCDKMVIVKAAVEKLEEVYA